MAVSYQSPLLAVAGAASPTEPSLVDATGVAHHYGDPLAEQRRLWETPSLVDRSQRAVIAVSGPDAPVFLNNLLSQKLDAVPAGYCASALDLDAQGHVLHHADVCFDGETYYLDVPAAQRESLRGYLERMVFWSDVTIDEPDLGIVTVFAPGAAPDAVPNAVPELDNAVFTREVPWTGGLRRIDAAVPRDGLAAAADSFVRAGGALAGLMAFSAQRVRAGEPELAADLDTKSIPHEVLRFIGRGEFPGAVHLAKGCYRGQETVARVENLGRSPRVLVMLQLDGSSPTEPAPGADITAGGRKAGRLGTVVHDADFGPIALALVKRSALGQALSIGDTAACVDPASLPTDEHGGAGRRAVDALRRGER